MRSEEEIRAKLEKLMIAIRELEAIEDRIVIKELKRPLTFLKATYWAKIEALRWVLGEK